MVRWVRLSQQFGCVLWHINNCRLCNAESSLYICMYILNIHDLVWLGFMLYQTLLVILFQILFIHIYQIYVIWFRLVLLHKNPCWLFNDKSCLCICIKYI